MTKRTVNHCGWSMSNGITICGADAKLSKTSIVGSIPEITCKACMNVLIHREEKELAEARAELTKLSASVDALLAHKKSLSW